jgi:hypothetical protein
MENNLRNRIYDGGFLNPLETTSFIELLSKGCNKNTREKIAWVVNNIELSRWKNYGIYNRVELYHSVGVMYCAGQDYTSEVRTVRECILEMHWTTNYPSIF